MTATTKNTVCKGIVYGDRRYPFTSTRIKGKVERRAVWAQGWAAFDINGERVNYNFEAMVFPEHSEHPEFEIENSRISKLWIKRMNDATMTYNWDRGADIEAADEATEILVSFLTQDLAKSVYGE